MNFFSHEALGLQIVKDLAPGALHLQLGPGATTEQLVAFSTANILHQEPSIFDVLGCLRSVD